jgi:hypothetical protein
MLTACLKPGLLATVVGVILLIGCKPAQQNNASEDSINQIVIEKIGDDFESHPSPSGSYLLFIEKVNPSSANPITKFIVLESGSQKVMIEKSFRPGYVKWIDDSVLELLDAPGTLKQNEDLSSYIKKIDLASNKN